jgi:diaminopimelate epimerase
MKLLEFTKMSGNGNDFIVIDNFNGKVKLSRTQIEALCTDRLSLGADGLLMLEKSPAGYDFYMKYYNNDGKEAEFCGNGGRCISRFAFINGYAKKHMKFMAKDGAHSSEILDNGGVKLRMIDPFDLRPDVAVRVAGRMVMGQYLNTGVPHYVVAVKNINAVDVKGLGKKLRFHKAFGPKGTNVNFVQKTGKNTYSIRTYERGVEDETLACGTGATASAIAVYIQGGAKSPVTLTARGGILKIYFSELDGCFTGVFLEGNARIIAKGNLTGEAFKF